MPRVKYCELVKTVQLMGLDSGKVKLRILMVDGTEIITKQFDIEQFIENKDDARVFFPEKK